MCNSGLLIKFLALLCVLATQFAHAHAQAEGVSVCERLLRDRSAIRSMPALESLSVRKSACSCIAASHDRLQSPQPSETSASDLESRRQFQSVCLNQAIASASLPLVPEIVSLALLQAIQANGQQTLSTAAQLINGPHCRNTKIDYPEIAVRQNAMGTSRYAFKIGRDSRILDAEILRSSGTTIAHKLLDAAGLAKLMACESAAATVNGQPIESWLEVEYVWRID